MFKCLYIDQIFTNNKFKITLSSQGFILLSGGEFNKWSVFSFSMTNVFILRSTITIKIDKFKKNSRFDRLRKRPPLHVSLGLHIINLHGESLPVHPDWLTGRWVSLLSLLSPSPRPPPALRLRLRLSITYTISDLTGNISNHITAHSHSCYVLHSPLFFVVNPLNLILMLKGFYSTPKLNF